MFISSTLKKIDHAAAFDDNARGDAAHVSGRSIFGTEQHCSC